MFLALKITQAVPKYNDIHWTIVWKDNSVQGGYSSSSCTQRLERKCRGFSVFDMCTIQQTWHREDFTYISKYAAWCLQSQPGKNSIQNAHMKTPFMVFPETHCLSNSIDHGKFKPLRNSFFFSTSSKACHSLTHCIPQHWKQSHKMFIPIFSLLISVTPSLSLSGLFLPWSSLMSSVTVVETHVEQGNSVLNHFDARDPSPVMSL